MRTDEYEKGRRKGEQIQRVRSHLAQHRGRRHLYDLGITNQERLNKLLRTRTEAYWQGYTDGLRPTPTPDAAP